MALKQLLSAYCLLLSLSLAANVGFSSYEYAPKPQPEKPKLEDKFTKPKLEKPNLEDKHLKTIGIRGLVYCRSGAKLIPLQGAIVRVTCLTIDNNGYEAPPFSLLSHATDGKGYFFATLDLSQLEGKGKLSECKAFLNESPVETCDVPTDVNKGMSGAPLGPYRLLPQKKMKLYSVGPFVYATEPPHSVGKGY